VRSCKESKIVFNTETLERLVSDPDWVLENEESFWENEKAQRYTRLWAKGVSREISYDEWRRQVREWAGIPSEERKDHVFMRNARKIIEGKEGFLNKALPHLCSYLPEEVNLGITVHFTAFIWPRAFAAGEIVINVSSTYWNNNVDNILNTLVHEIFHVGFSYCRSNLRKEEKLEDETLYSMLDNFQSEGICCYVGYKALPMFPAPDEKDYKLLESMSDVKRLLKDVNWVFSKVGAVSRGELQRLAWEKCIIGRGYYVVGAFMCKTIEQKRGRETLIGTLTEGPVSFIKSYNSLVEEDMRVKIKSL